MLQRVRSSGGRHCKSEIEKADEARGMKWGVMEWKRLSGRIGSAIFQISFLPSLSLSHSRSVGDDGLSGHASSGVVASMEEKARAPRKPAQSQRASREEGGMVVERVRFRRLAPRDQWNAMAFEWEGGGEGERWFSCIRVSVRAMWRRKGCWEG